MPKFSLALLLCAAGWAAAQSWTPEDLWNRHIPSDTQISPDGQQVVYRESWNDRERNATFSNLWLASVRDRQTRRLTDGPWDDRAPRWSADSTRIAWIRDGVHVLDVRSGKESTIAGSPQSLAWSADGGSIAFTAAVEPKIATPMWAPADILPLLVLPAARHTGAFVVAAGGGTPQAITPSDFDAVGAPAWMPDGRSILAAGADGQIYSIRIADHTARALNQEPGIKQHPLPAPNGSKIAWMATEAQPHSYSVRKLYVMNSDGSHVKELASGLDRDPVDPHWSSDSRTIYFLADDSGTTRICAARADSTLRTVSKASERLRDFSLADNGHAAMVRSTARSEEVVTLTVDLPPPNPVVLAAGKIFAERDSATAEELHFDSAGISIQAWLVKPPAFDESKKYPLLLDIADAPRRMYGPEFDLEAQIFAARGWLVLHVNPRGTPGYGEHFGRLLPTRYPGDDADDLLAALDAVTAKGYVDGKRVALRGGLLAAWLLGHSDRFATAIVRRPIVDFALFASGHPREALAWMGAMPWDDPEQYTRHSPIYSMQNWKTPTLVLAADRDPQAEELFAVLRDRQVEATLVRLPDETPATQLRALEAQLSWLARRAE